MKQSILGLGLKALVGASLVNLPAGAEDWPQFRGPNHDSHSSEKIEKTWPSPGPKLVWKVALGPGFSSFAVAGGKAFTLHERGDNKEACIALDANSGEKVWQTDLGDTTHEKQGGAGPRSTPTVDGDRVYTLSTYLALHCLSAKDGKVIWKQDLPGAQNNTRGIQAWGNAASPIVEGDLVIVAGGGPGESILAYNKADGKVVWKKHDEKITHASPTPATIHGQRQIIFFMQSGLVSVEPKSGEVLWKHPFRWNVSTAASPVVADDIVYCSAAYGVGAGAVKVNKASDGWKATELWTTPGQNMHHWSTPVHHEGHIYGISGFRVYRSGPLACIDIKTGQEKWSQPGFGQGGTIFVDGHILVLGEEGQIVLVQATPGGYKETARTHPLSYKAWNMPVVSNGRIYARSDRGAVCLDVSAK